MEKHTAGLPRIQLHFLIPVTVRKRTLLKTFLVNQFLVKKVPIRSLQIIFCTDEYLLHLNQRFLQHDTYTDVITFNLADAGDPVIGEIYISVDRVRENAKDLSVELTEELHRIIFHGMLHLMGLRDTTKREREEMRRMETALIKKYKRFVSRGT